MQFRNLQRIEHLTDAAWTLLRFCLTVVPAMTFGIIVVSRFPDPEEFRRIASPEDVWMVAHVRDVLIAGLGSAGLIVFVFLQLIFRSPLGQSDMQAWLAIHGWDGSTARSPYRTIVPIAEWCCLLAASLFCAVTAPAYFVLLPLTVAIMRLVSLLARQATVSMLQAAMFAVLIGIAVLFVEQWQISMPPVLVILYITLLMQVDAERKLSDTLMMTDLQFNLGNTVPRSLRRTVPAQQQISPFYQLRSNIVDWRPTWPQALVLSTIVAWLTFCVFFQIGTAALLAGRAGHPQNSGSVEDGLYVGLFFMATAIGVIRLFQGISGPYPWVPRLGPISRIITWRLVVPSYDRILKPFLLSAAIGMAIAWLPGEYWLAKFVVAEYLMLLIALRCGPSDPEVQMTSDARLFRC